MIKKIFEKYAWVVFAVIGTAVLAGSIPHALGLNTDPALVQSISGKTIVDLKTSSSPFFNLYNFYFRGGGLSDLGFAFFLIVVSATAYRRGQRWAWYAFWFIPMYFLCWVMLSLTLPAESQSSLLSPLIIFIILSLIGLLLPFKMFFPTNKLKIE